MEPVGDHRGRKVMGAGDHVGDDFGICGVWDGGFENTDDRARPITQEPTIQTHGLAEDGGILLESSGPKTIGENHNAGCIGTVVLRSDEPPENGVEADDVEVVAADNASLNFTGFT